MFLKRISIRKSGKRHTYWALVKSVRTAPGPRHQVVSYLGELEPGEKAGWTHVGRITRRLQSAQLHLFDDTGPCDPVPEKVEVLVRQVRVERTRDFGNVYLGLLLWQTLELDKLLDRKIKRGRSRIPWPLMATVSTLARFCEPSSELHIADTWYLRTALDDLLGIPDHLVNTQRLYRTHDALLPHKEAIETHLKERFATLFDTAYDLLLYDVTSVLLQTGMEFSAVMVKVDPNGGKRHEQHEGATTFHRPGEGGDFAAAPGGQGAGIGPVRGAADQPHALLPLAERPF